MGCLPPMNWCRISLPHPPICHRLVAWPILPGAEEKEAPWQHQPAFNGGPPEPRNREVCEHNSDILRHNSNLT